jgi:hypothetical protein
MRQENPGNAQIWTWFKRTAQNTGLEWFGFARGEGRKALTEEKHEKSQA